MGSPPARTAKLLICPGVSIAELPGVDEGIDDEEPTDMLGDDETEPPELVEEADA